MPLHWQLRWEMNILLEVSQRDKADLCCFPWSGLRVICESAMTPQAYIIQIWPHFCHLTRLIATLTLTICQTLASSLHGEEKNLIISSGLQVISAKQWIIIDTWETGASCHRETASETEMLWVVYLLQKHTVILSNK